MKILPRMFLVLGYCAIAALVSCGGRSELSEESIDALGTAGLNEILEKTATKPWQGEAFVPGTLGGTWNNSLTEDPKSFNILVAERDATTAAIVGYMQETLIEYNPVSRQWDPRAASYEIITNQAMGTLTVLYTLRDDLYWSFYNSDQKIRVSSDDMVFWYNEIWGDPAFQSSSYWGQFLEMEDGAEAHIAIEKIDDRRFAFHFPRIIADPLLKTSYSLAPRFGYEEAKRNGGAQGVLDIYNVSVDPQTIPSVGRWFLAEYSPNQRMVYKRNPNYWKKDSRGLSYPYREEQIIQILPDRNTEFLLFKDGKLDAYGARIEDLDELVNKTNAGYTVFNPTDGTLTAPFWVFNQNPRIKDRPEYEWFTQKEFRQAMSCLLNRDRILRQVFRGLADPKYTIFPEPNPYYDPAITLSYRYDPARALSLLSSIGMGQDAQGIMRDSKGRAVEFDLSIESDATVYTDMASIIMDELSKVGITVNVRTIDFQKLVEQLTATYDWSSLFIRLGSNYFPSQGSNVWPSAANLHLWHPLQERPATEWEARLDYLYNEGSYTIDHTQAKGYWDEFQQILLEQCPMIYLARQRYFQALQNRWDFSNMYYDNVKGFEIEAIFLKQP